LTNGAHLGGNLGNLDLYILSIMTDATLETLEI
jgi:hypothetical protein